MTVTLGDTGPAAAGFAIPDDDVDAIRYATGARQLLSGQGAGGTSSHPMSSPGAFSSQL